MPFTKLGWRQGPAELWWENGRLQGGPIRKKARQMVNDMLCDTSRTELQKWLIITKKTPANGFTLEELDEIKKDLTNIVEYHEFSILEGIHNSLVQVNEILPLWIQAKWAKNEWAMPRDNKNGLLVKGTVHDMELRFMETEYQQMIGQLML